MREGGCCEERALTVGDRVIVSAPDGWVLFGEVVRVGMKTLSLRTDSGRVLHVARVFCTRLTGEEILFAWNVCRAEKPECRVKAIATDTAYSGEKGEEGNGKPSS